MLGGEFRVAQAAGVSSATWLIGNLGKMNWINCPLYVKLVAASLEQGLNYSPDAAFFPEPPKDKLWPDPQNRDSLSLSGGMRIDNREVFAMT